MQDFILLAGCVPFTVGRRFPALGQERIKVALWDRNRMLFKQRCPLLVYAEVRYGRIVGPSKMIPGELDLHAIEALIQDVDGPDVVEPSQRVCVPHRGCRGPCSCTTLNGERRCARAVRGHGRCTAGRTCLHLIVTGRRWDRLGVAAGSRQPGAHRTARCALPHASVFRHGHSGPACP